MPGAAIGKLNHDVSFIKAAISLSLKAQFPSRAKAFLATLARVAGADAPCPVQILGKIDPARAYFAEGKQDCRFGLRLSRRNFFKIVNPNLRIFTGAAVHKGDIVSNRKILPQRKVVRGAEHRGHPAASTQVVCRKQRSPTIA